MAADAFTQIRNAVFRDSRLTAKAMGIFGNISTHRDGWGITPESISKQMRDGVSAIKAGLRELEQYGYLQRERERRPDGTLGASTYFITDQPELMDKARSEPEVDFPPVDEPPVAEPPVGDHLHKKIIPLQEDQLAEDDLSLLSVSTQQADPAPAAEEREILSPFEEPGHPTPLPGVDVYAARLADAAVARMPAPRGEAQRQDGPQASPQPPAPPAAPTDAANRIIAAYTAILGRPVLARTRTTLHHQAAEALATGYPEAWLTDRARELAAHGWSDLAKHVEKSVVPLPGATPPAASRTGTPAWCGECGGGMPAQFNPRFRRREDGSLCHCHPDAAICQPIPGRGSWQPYKQPTAEERTADLGHF